MITVDYVEHVTETWGVGQLCTDVGLLHLEIYGGFSFPAVLRLELPRVLEYSSTTRVVNYSSNFLLLEYSLISISGCKFPFPVAVFLQSIDNFTPSVLRVAPAGRKTSKSASELLKYRHFALHKFAYCCR